MHRSHGDPAMTEDSEWAVRQGYAAGGASVLATGQTKHGRACREVLIETAMAGRPTDQRVRTYCRDGAGWSMVASIGK